MGCGTGDDFKADRLDSVSSDKVHSFGETVVEVVEEAKSAKKPPVIAVPIHKDTDADQ
jgi:hypothetical protein